MPREPSPINDRASSYKDTSDVESPTGAARGGAFPAGKRAVSTTEAAASEPMTRCDRYILLFRQGLLPSMQTTLSPVTVMLTLMVVAALGIVLGVVVVMAADTAIEVKVRYDHVNQYKYPITSPDIARSANNGGVNFTAENRWFMQGMDVVVDFTVDKVMQPPIMLSYHLTNFYQNYRYYAASLNNLQLVGSSVAAVDLSLCAPLRSPSELRSEIESRSSIKINGQPFLYGDMVYLPCGAVPWSMFNDSITLYAMDAQGVAVTGLICNASDFAPNGNRLTLSATQNACVKKGIAWPSDRAHRFLTEDWQFKTPTMWTGRGANTTDDEYLAHGWYAKEPGHKIPDPVDEDLMVWMRLATLPEFRKLHRMITAPILPGKYRLVVKEFFDSTSYSGSKSIMLSTFSWAGGKDYVLGYMLLGGGVAAMVLCGALFGRFMIRRASSDDGDNATEAPDDQRSVA